MHLDIFSIEISCEIFNLGYYIEVHTEWYNSPLSNLFFSQYTSPPIFARHSMDNSNLSINPVLIFISSSNEEINPAKTKARYQKWRFFTNCFQI